MRRSDHILRRDATIEDLRALGDEVSAEIINGDLVEKAAPSFKHGFAQGSVLTQLGPRFGGPPRDGGGGWWLVSEVEVAYEPRQIFRHDLLGWRRERLPEPPDEWPVHLRPDWVCEIVSRSNASNDSVKKLRVLHKHAVPHLWLISPSQRTLTVHRWTEAGYLTALTAEAGERVRAEPFAELELDTSALFVGG